MTQRVQDLIELTSKPGWDDEGGVVITAERWEAARWLVQSFDCQIARLPEPYFSASGDGEIHVNWSSSDRSLDLELSTDGIFRWVIRGVGRRRRYRATEVATVVDHLRSLFTPPAKPSREATIAWAAEGPEAPSILAWSELGPNAGIILNEELTRDEVLARAAQLAKDLGFETFDEVLRELDAGRITKTSHELKARGLRHLLQGDAS